MGIRMKKTSCGYKPGGGRGSSRQGAENAETAVENILIVPAGVGSRSRGRGMRRRKDESNHDRTVSLRRRLPGAGGRLPGRGVRYSAWTGLRGLGR